MGIGERVMSGARQGQGAETRMPWGAKGLVHQSRVGAGPRRRPGARFVAQGAREVEVRSYAEAVELLNWGLANRIMASNLMNFLVAVA